jgi:hypothetical protein
MHFFFFFLAVLGLNSEPHACEASTLPLEPHPQPFFASVIFQIFACIFVQGQHWTDILLPMPPSSWSRRHATPCQACWLRWSLTTYAWTGLEP